jgi:hypothetical protein
MGTIRVTGRASVRVRPDTTRITFDLGGMYKEYGETLRHSSEDTDALKNVLAPFGFDRSDLKTLSFDVNTEYESYREDDVYKQRFTGYRYNHQMKVEFPSDNERLGNIVYALANCSLSPEFRLSYTVSDSEAVKNEVLGKAVSDSKAKALVLAEAAGVGLGSICSIDYSWGEVELEVAPMRNGIFGDGQLRAKCSLDIEPDDISIEDTVTVVWELV